MVSLAPPWTSPATPQHLADIDTARRLGAKVRFAAGVAIFSGWSTAIFAFLTLGFGAISQSMLGSLLGIGMAIVAIYEFRGASALRRLDPDAPRRLALNQVVFGLLLFAYGAISLYTTLADPSALVGEISKYPELRDMADQVTQLVRMTVIAVYGSVMLFAILGPGLTAWYYASRRRYVEQYLQQSPQWVQQLQRAGMSIS